MFKKPTKRQFIIRRIILSSVATLAVIIIATAAILFMLGYRLDGNNGRFEQGALLQFDSSPSNADVYIDGRTIGTRTSTKQTVVAGTHTIKMTKNGYQSWNRTLDIAAGTLTWLDYILLVPNERPVQKVANYESLVGMTVSPDSKWALAQEKADAPTYHLVDLRSIEVKSSLISIPTSIYAESATEGVSHSFSVVSWDSGSRHVLVKHLYSGKTEWLVVDTQNAAATINATQLLSVDFKDLHFAGTSGKVLYALTTDGAVRKLDLSAATMSRAFVTHVDSFDLYDNTIVSYVGVDPEDPSRHVAGVYRDGDELSHVLRSTVADDVELKIASSKYFSDHYVAIAEGSKVTILKGNYPSLISPETKGMEHFANLELAGAVSALSFSPKGDYVLAQSGETFKSYEIEHKRSDVGTIPTDAGRAASTLKWLDDAHLWNDDKDTLTIRDFNGINMLNIMDVERGFDARLSQNGRFFYAVGKGDKGYHLQRVKMILD